MKRLGSKLTYANIVATLALFIAVGGASAFAATKLAKNSVGTKQIKNGAVTGAKVKNGSLTGAKIAAGSISGSNIDLSSLGTVPSATTARSAVSAESAATAGSALTAGSAGTAKTSDQATHAVSADDAGTLGGQPPSAFAAATEIVSGSAPSNTASANTILTLPGGPEVTTKPGTNGIKLGIVVPAGQWYVAASGSIVGSPGPHAFEVTLPEYVGQFYLIDHTLEREWVLICTPSAFEARDRCTAISAQ
jgi:hypothetical protein